MVEFRIDEAYLIGAWCAAALWGIFTSLVAYCLYHVAQRASRGTLHRSQYITTAAVILLYFIATAHMSMALRRLIVGFILHDGDSMPYFADIGLGHSVVMLRAADPPELDLSDDYRRFRGRLALLFYLVAREARAGASLSGYASIGQYFLVNPSPAVSVAWGTSMFAISLTTNVFVTLLSAGRIWYLSTWVYCDQPSSTSAKYRTIILLIIESGAVIAAAKLTEFTLFRVAPGDGRSGNNSLYIIFEMMPQINGIMPTIIIVVVNAGKTLCSAQCTIREPSSGIIFAPSVSKVKTDATTEEDCRLAMQGPRGGLRGTFEDAGILEGQYKAAEGLGTSAASLADTDSTPARMQITRV
ncbi:hypothetical protein EVG20_g1895 [Dentipellis fragilis]|uniref:Uncharacterized protein n=1 Tax=Dentipellis fragilis TaxID=205917 RepID=A0A4Y9ZBB1_9AGAM|nr:hypothetical protein EVG20_g1895 [Dentipellis fragilis]